MANCNRLFSTYHSDISIPGPKKERMKTSKKALRDKIRKHFKDNHPEYVPKFFIQGSDKMKNGIRTKDDICDLDDGVYFFRQPDVTATTLQTWVKDAVDGHTGTAPEHRKKCIRSPFVNDYEIDHPVYYKVDGQEYKLAIKNTGWEDSDPKAMVDWFNGKKDKNGQLVRVTKFLKGWCDNRRHRMPNGLVMTILASNAKDRFIYNERDDITLRDTLKEIKKALDNQFTCVVPVTPKDDLFADYDDIRKNNFLEALKEFIDDADAALKEPNELKASKLWRKHLGDRFPLGEDKEETSARNNSLYAGGVTSYPFAF
jgi:Cyclic GMP-AMP synthase DncV-like, nucleotidyltransferase domain